MLVPFEPDVVIDGSNHLGVPHVASHRRQMTFVDVLQTPRVHEGNRVFCDIIIASWDNHFLSYPEALSFLRYSVDGIGVCVWRRLVPQLGLEPHLDPVEVREHWALKCSFQRAFQAFFLPDAFCWFNGAASANSSACWGTPCWLGRCPRFWFGAGGPFSIQSNEIITMITPWNNVSMYSNVCQFLFSKTLFN